MTRWLRRMERVAAERMSASCRPKGITSQGDLNAIATAYQVKFNVLPKKLRLIRNGSAMACRWGRS